MLRKTEGRRGRQRMRWLDEHEQTLGESKGQGSLASGSPWGRRESDVTLRLNKKLLEDRNCGKQEDIFLTPSINVPSQPTPPTLIFLLYSHQLCSVQFSRSVVSDSLRPHESQHARPPCLSSTPGVHSNSRPSSQWCHPAISSSVIPFSCCPQSLLAPESFPMSQRFTWGGQSTGVSALTSFLPKNTQDWSPLEWTGWISLQSKGLSRVFSYTTVQKHQFFSAQPSSQSNSHIHTWPLEKP